MKVLGLSLREGIEMGLEWSTVGKGSGRAQEKAKKCQEKGNENGIMIHFSRTCCCKQF